MNKNNLCQDVINASNYIRFYGPYDDSDYYIERGSLIEDKWSVFYYGRCVAENVSLEKSFDMVRDHQMGEI